MFLLSAFLPFGSKFCVKTSESETDGWEGTTLIVDSSYQPVVGDDLSVKTTYLPRCGEVVDVVLARKGMGCAACAGACWLPNMGPAVLQAASALVAVL